jgi:hypothetical protein
MSNLEHGGAEPVRRRRNPMWDWVAFAVFAAIVIGASFAMFGFEEEQSPGNDAAAVTQQGDV